MAQNEGNNAKAGSESTVRTLMGATGQACKVTGYAMKGVSTLYLANSLTTAGVATIEYLTTTERFFDHMRSRSTLTWRAAGLFGVALGVGFLLYKAGSYVSSERNIRRAEAFLNNDEKDAKDE